MNVGYVVEGTNDKAKVIGVIPDARVVVTQGTRMNNRIRTAVKQLLTECNAVYILSDPDHAGDILADMLMREFPQLERINLDREECKIYTPRGIKIGVEHCAEEYLKRVLFVG